MCVCVCVCTHTHNHIYKAKWALQPCSRKEKLISEFKPAIV